MVATSKNQLQLISAVARFVSWEDWSIFHGSQKKYFSLKLKLSEEHGLWRCLGRESSQCWLEECVVPNFPGRSIRKKKSPRRTFPFSGVAWGSSWKTNFWRASLKNFQFQSHDQLWLVKMWQPISSPWLVTYLTYLYFSSADGDKKIDFLGNEMAPSYLSTPCSALLAGSKNCRSIPKLILLWKSRWLRRPHIV